GPEVGESAESGADLQQASFGTLVRGQGIEFVAADGAEQDGIAGEGGVEGFFRKRCAVVDDGDAADALFFDVNGVATEFGGFAQDCYGFVGNFGSDAVAGGDKDFQLHYCSLLRRIEFSNDIRTASKTVQIRLKYNTSDKP